MEREIGTLKTWDNEKAYGFIQPHNDNADMFVHGTSLPPHQRRPRPGDVLTYEVAIDEKGRYVASSTKIAGIAWSWFTSVGICLAASLGLYAYLAIQKIVPFTPLSIYLGMSLLTIWAYSHDKRAAQLGHWRIPEMRLHILELLGGWPGAFFAQRYYRHKLRKLSYQIMFWMIVAGHCVLGYYAMRHHEQYQHVVTVNVQSIIHSLRGQFERHSLKTAERAETSHSTTPSRPFSRSRVVPVQNARILGGIVKEIRPQQGVVVALQSGTGSEGIIQKNTLVHNFASTFTPGEHIAVAIQTITIEGKQKHIDLILVENHSRE